MPKEIWTGQFRNELRGIKNEYDYPNIGDAPVHFALQLIFKLHNNEAGIISICGNIHSFFCGFRIEEKNYWY